MLARRVVSAPAFSLRAFYICFLALFAFSSVALAQQRQVLQRHVPASVTSHAAPLVNYVTDDQVIHSSIVLPLRNLDALKALLTRLYDPSSPDYHHFLSVDQFTEQFGPTSDDFNAVAAFARSNGLSVSSLPANRMVVPVSGTTAQINAAFHVRMSVYQHPSENRTFVVPDREPSLDLAIPVAHISGLDSYSLPHPNLVRGGDSGVHAMVVSGSGPGGAYLGSDMRAAYYGGSTLTGNGQAVGILEFGGYARGDVDLTFSNASQTNNVPINDVLLNGATTGSGAGDAEQVLDIVQAIGMAPGLSQVRVYIGPAGITDDANILNTMASENIAKQLSCSWGWRPADPSVDDVFFQEMAAQGQSFFTSSGDAGAFDAAISPFFYPQEDQYVTAVGGTHLSTSGPGGNWAGETVWNSVNGGAAGGSGGGISPDGITIPSWQAGLANSANGGSATLRNVPDVAMEGDFDNYACENSVCAGNWAGTSFAAPRWAGFMALVNQQAQEAGNTSTGGIGFINPTVYRLAQASASSGDFHDITSGNNLINNQPLWFSATPGYDLTTGWGSANGQALIDDLAGPQVPGFWLASSQSSVGVAPGGTATATVTISDAGGFTGDVTLAASGLPADVTASFSPNPATASSVLTFTGSASAVQSLQNVTITGTSGTLSASTNLSLAVHTPTFALSASPSTLGISQGSSGTTTITVSSQYGFSNAVSLAVSGLPSGVTASFSPSSTMGTSTLTLSVSSTATPGNSTLTVTGTSGSITTSIPIALSIHGPSFTLSDSNSVSVGQGSSATTSVYIQNLYGFNGSVNLAVTGLPDGVTATVNPNPVTSNYAVITFTASSAATISSSTVTITGTSGALSSTTTMTLGVFAPTFSISTNTAVSIGQGTSTNDYVYISSSYGFNGNVNLSISGLPAGVTSLWSPNPTTSSSTLTLAASSAAKVGQYPITITGTYGSITKTTTFTLSVNTPTFTITTPGGVTLGQGTATTTYVDINAEYGFTGSVNLSASNLPAGVTASFSPNPATYQSTLALTSSGTTAVGQYTITITGTSGTQTVTTTMTVSIVTPTFTLSSYGVSVGRGASTNAFVYIYGQNGFTGNVTLSASGLPSGVTVSFSPNPTTYSSNLTINASSTVALGQFNITVTGTSGTQTATTVIPVTVYNPTFSLSASGTASLGQGNSTTSYVYITPQYGFTGTINLAVSGLPSGVTYSFSPNPTTASSTLTLTASATAAAGQYPLMITGTSGSITQTASLALTVGAPTFTINAGSTTISQGGSGSSYVYLNTQFGFSGTVNFATSSLPAGVTANFSPASSTYSSTLNFTVDNSAAIGATTITITGTSGTKTVTTTMLLTVVAPAFSLFLPTSAIQLNQGSTAAGYVYLTEQNGFTGNVALTATGLPVGATITFSPNPTTLYNNQFTIAGNAPAGTYTVTISGTSGATTSSANFSLTIVSPVFALSASSGVTLTPGSSRKVAVSAAAMNGFSGNISYSITGLPSGVTATVSPNPSSSQTVVTFTASSSATATSSVATITGTSGSISASTPINVNVVPTGRATAITLAATYNGQPASTLSGGLPITLSATVKAGTTPVLAGQVTFCDASAKSCDPAHILGTAQLTTGGTASFKFIPSPGTNTYKAIFNRTVSNLAATSSTVTLTVNSAFSSQTAMNVTGSIGNYTVTSTVTGNGPVAPSGSASIIDTTEGNASIGSISLTAGTPTLTAKSLAGPTVGSSPVSLGSGDFNGDGAVDLVVANSGSSSLSILIGNGDGTFQVGSPLALGSSPAGVFVSDFNGDGRLDIAAPLTYGSSVVVFLGNGDGTFTPSQSSSQVGSYPLKMLAADFNQDGIQDLVVSNEYSGTLTLLLGDGSGAFIAKNISLSSNVSQTLMNVGDFNGDGIQDLVIGGSSYSLTILLGNGDGTFTQGTTITSSYYGNTGAAVGDFNQDGKTDLAFYGYYNSPITILLGNGDGTFTSSTGPNISSASNLAISDINHDGNPDLIVASGNSTVSIFLGKGDGTFTPTSNLPISPNLVALSAVDLNGDGVPDLASVNNDGTISVTVLSFAQTATGKITGVSAHGAGQHTIAASFPGDSIFAPSTSPTQKITAVAGPPNVTIKPNSTTINAAQSLSVSITVAGGSADPVPTGTVQLSSGGYTSMAVALANGAATFSIPAGTLAVGTDSLVTTYTPDAAGTATYTTGTGAASVTVVKVGPATTTSFTLSNNNLTFTASVSSAAPGTPTGQVTFYAGSTVLGAATLNAGVATYTATAFPAGNPILSAVYAGDANFAGSSSTAAPVLTVSPTSSTLTVSSASSVQDVLTFSVPQGYVGSLQVACSGLPQYATCSLSPTSFSLAGNTNSVTTTLTIHTGGTASASPASSPFGPKGSRTWLAALGLSGILGSAFVTRRRRSFRMRSGVLATLALCAFACMAIVGCAGGSSSNSTTSTNSGTPTPNGIYTVQVTTTGGSSLSQTTTLPLTVQ